MDDDFNRLFGYNRDMYNVRMREKLIKQPTKCNLLCGFSKCHIIFLKRENNVNIPTMELQNK